MKSLHFFLNDSSDPALRSVLQYAQSIDIQTSGKYLIFFTKGTQVGLVRFNSDWTVDRSFATQGAIYQSAGYYDNLSFAYGVSGLVNKQNGDIFIAGAHGLDVLMTTRLEERFLGHFCFCDLGLVRE